MTSRATPGTRRGRSVPSLPAACSTAGRWTVQWTWDSLAPADDCWGGAVDAERRCRFRALIASRQLPGMPPGWVVPSHLRSPIAIELFERCLALIDARDLHRESCLRVSCQHAGRCWAVEEGCPTSPVLPRLPWIGPDYLPGGVVIVGMNAPTHAGLFDETFVTEAAFRELEAGRQRFFGSRARGPSWFHYRAAVAAGLLIDWAAGRVPTVREPVTAVEAVMASARIQAVQCAPANGPRRTPTSAMLKHCPTHLAWPTLEILAPRRVALFGTATRRAFEKSHQVEWIVSEPLLRRGTTLLGKQLVDVFSLRHPSSGFGMQSILALQFELSDSAQGPVQST
jgi:hypothetical protein